MARYSRVSDRLALPHIGKAIVAAATRDDRYHVHVTRRDDVALKQLLSEVNGRRIAIITDHNVAAAHARQLAGNLADSGVEVSLTSFLPGEASKSMGTAFDLLDWLAGTSMARRDVVLAVGGGVVIDTVGWVASAYMRGIPYVNVPTTLLAQVDAAVGGKVAVDHRSAKNLIGSFYQPKAVVSNVGYLSTLDRRHVGAGLAEAIKKGVIASPELFGLIDSRSTELLDGDPATLEQLVRSASAIKCQLIARDPYEEDLRRPLNFGHTVGHAVETVTGYGPVLHGEAVAFGMVVATRIAERRGLLTGSLRERLVNLLRRLELPVHLGDLAADVDIDDVVGAIGQVRKIRDGKIRFVLPVELGETLIADDVSDEEIRSALRSLVPETVVSTP